MSDLRSSFTSKDFVINANIVKCISSLDITLNEFLLLLYFINVSNNLDMNDIKNKLGFSDELIFSSFNNLVSKKYIEMVVENKNDEVIEKINLDPFYDRLALNKKVDNDTNNDIYALYERELGRTLSSFEYEMINKWKEQSISEDIIKGALKEAILNGVTSFKYIDKIVYEWSKNGIKKSIKKDNDYKEIEEYNWLEEDNE